ncbi:MAG TPA: hypothetical protein VFG54_12070 [Prolixibacteraceae bacterium]|nr:hypothetical protein [Prolixibacteraceae bacterium]
MKRFICLMIFTIGLFVSLPATSSGSGSPPTDQPCFVADQLSADMPVMAINQALDVEVVQIFELNSYPQLEATLPIGNCFADKQPVFYLPRIYTCNLDRIKQLNYAANQRPPNATRKSFPHNMMVEYGLIRTTRESTLV